ncbi:TonB-dependent receptor plug domain-containing protein [Lacunisphaera limnophila]|uniref:TonB-dependent receptor plug domain-containing protein n=1 Tax=Lacunisphaera limnophila TaxID=1838286 RepID=UPI000859776C|nr:TonB-dependent receptor plug domain-containing protein [Lacunisphaera limnophila]
MLSPFVVDASEDADSYAAKSTLAGTRVRTELKDVASAISVVTKQFMRDTGATDSASLLQYTTNTEVGGLGGNFSGNAGGLQFNEDSSLRRPNTNTRVRGLDSADNTRDYFLTEIPWDGYNVDRVDLQRGPNSILFGVGSPAGIINTSVNSATFKNKNSFENRIDKFGSMRFTADFNYVLLPNELAVRVAALDDKSQYRQEPAYNHDKRVFGAIRYTPQLFGEGANTSIRANFESGKVNANRPRTLPPVDSITPWFYTGTDGQGNLMLNKFTYDASKVNPGNAPFNRDNRGAYPFAYLNNGAVGRQFWTSIVGFYGNNEDSNATFIMQPGGGSGRNGIGPNGQPDLGIGGLPSARAVGITSFSSYMIASGLPGGANYADRSLSDPTIFDFYNNLIDGNNKFEWQNWNSGNVAIAQTFLNDRVGFEAVLDYQRYKDGARVFLGNSDTYKIGIDLMSHFHDGTANPNVGRAYVANSTERANNMADIERDGLRFTGYAELRADDFLDKSSKLAKILGRHVLTGLVSQDEKRVFDRSWATSAATADYTAFTGESNNLSSHFRSYDFVSYISETSLASRTSASGAFLSRVNNIVRAPNQALVRVFDNHWARSTTPGDANYVDPAAAYSWWGLNSQLPFMPANNGLISTGTQSENPANYVGWRNMVVDMLDADNGDIDALTTGSNRSLGINRSQGLTWQGYMFGDVLVPVFGWRKDRIENSNYSGTPDALGVVSTDFNIPESRKNFATGESKSWGAVLHVPAKWTSFLPASTTVSGFFNRSENFKADAIRGDVFGNAIPNPLGKTKEYGVVISTLDDKLTLKVTKYETTVANATLPGSNPLGQNSYFLWAVPVWGTAFVTNADQGIKGNNDNNSWAWNYAANDDSAAPQFRNPDQSLNQAWQNHPSTIREKAAIDAWRQLPLEQSFFGAYGGEVALINVEAMRAGNWPAADPIWQQKFDNQPGPGGTGFGTGTFTVDTVSKGYEIELLAQPTKNWNVSVNASKTFASRAALAPTIVTLMEEMTTFLAGPAGDIRLWGGGASNALRLQWQNNIVNPYNTFKSQEGSNAPEIAPWRFNAVTTYNFSEGRLKGSWIGGAYRWEDKRVLGYQFDPTIGNTGGALDITKPWKSDTDAHLDMWIGHSRKISEKINWRVQLNLRSVGESTGLVPVSLNPDGTVAFSRIQEGMVWQLTNTFEF